MADSRTRARRGARRSGRYAPRVAAETVSDSGKKTNSGRRSTVKQKPTVFPDLDNDTPRVMLKRIIRTQPQVSPLTPQVPKHEEKKEARSELPSKRISGTLLSVDVNFLEFGKTLLSLVVIEYSRTDAKKVEMQLPDFVPEDTSITTFHVTKKRKKLSVSEFERAANKRLPQNQAQSTLDSTALARSLRMSLGSLIPPDTVEKRGLLRRPKNRKAIDMEAFEGEVKKNLLKSKVQNYLVDSQTTSGIQATMKTNDAEMLNNTELFVQPQFGERSQNKLSALEPQLSDSKTSPQRSKISDAAQEEARLVGLVSRVGTDEGRTRRRSENLILDHEHVGRMTRVSPKPPANQQEDTQVHSQQSNPMEQLAEEVVAGIINRWSSFLSSLSQRKGFSSPVTLKPERSVRMFVREVASRIIKDLDENDTEEMANTVNRVEQEENFREDHHANSEYSKRLEKKLTKNAELQVTTAQRARVKTEVTPSEDKGIAEGSIGHQVSPRGELEVTRGVGAGNLGRHSHAASFSEKSGMKPLKQAAEQADEVEDEPIMIELDGLEEEPTEDEAEDSGNEEVSMKTPTFVRAAACKPLLSTPHPAKPAVPNFPQRSPFQLLGAKPVPKRSGVPQRKTREPEIASSLIKKIFSHYAKMPVTRDAFKIVEKCCERYFKQVCNDLEAYTNHARRKTVEKADLEVLMRRQGLVTDKMPLHVLIERYLPLEYRKLLIPVAMSGNRVVPCP